MKDHKIQKFVEPGMQMALAVLAVFAVITWFIRPVLAYIEGFVALSLLVYFLIRRRQHRRELQSLVESVTYNAESATNNTLIHFPLPMAVFRLSDSTVVWGNQLFWTMCSRSSPAYEARLTDLVPAFSSKWLMEGKTRHAELLEVNGRKYQLNGNMVRAGATEDTYEFMGITYWVDVTEYESARQEFFNSRPAVMLIIADNYDELMKSVTDRQRTELRGKIDEAVESWCEGKNGILRRFDRDRYLFIFERRYMDEIVKKRFDLVERVRAIENPAGMRATVSIGVGTDGAGYAEDYSFASLAVDMALSRGGDQAVIKNKINFEFFGGRGAEVETRTKVKSRVMANSLSRLIQDASRVYIMGHRFADLDAVGAAVGVACIAHALGKGAGIVIGEENAAKPLIEQMQNVEGYRDIFLDGEEALLKADSRTLLVVVDTHRPEQVESESLLMACSNRLALIDHHRRAATYIQNAALTLYEPNASSACELVSELMEELLETRDILPQEADAVLAGIVLDTKSFTIRTNDHTFDAAAFLKRMGADTVRVKAFFKTGLEETMARYDILRQAKIYKGIAVAAVQDEQSRVVAAQAADELLNVTGVSASVVMYPTTEQEVIVSARSIGDVNVQVLLEKLGGGGNKSVAGAQMKDISLREAVNKLFGAINEYRATE